MTTSKMTTKQALAALAAGAALRISDDAMGRARYSIIDGAGAVYDLSRASGAVMPLTAMRCVDRKATQQIWQMR